MARMLYWSERPLFTFHDFSESAFSGARQTREFGWELVNKILWLLCWIGVVSSVFNLSVHFVPYLWHFPSFGKINTLYKHRPLGKIRRRRSLSTVRARSLPSLLFRKGRAAARAFSGADQTREKNWESRKITKLVWLTVWSVVTVVLKYWSEY